MCRRACAKMNFMSLVGFQAYKILIFLWKVYCMLGEINFPSKLLLRASIFFVWKLSFREKKEGRRSWRYLENLLDGGQKPSVIDVSQNTMQHGCYRHYSVIFHGKGMTVQCDPTWWYQVSTLHSEKSLSNQKVHPWLSKSNVTNSALKLPRRKFQ